jgi:hypothetical protein
MAVLAVYDPYSAVSIHDVGKLPGTQTSTHNSKKKSSSIPKTSSLSPPNAVSESLPT